MSKTIGPIHTQVPTKAIAFYLPQYHPIPENDEWWGKGFTEWRNVSKAKQLFNGHYQPHIPADLGYYDLRLREARESQANLAKTYGVHGFGYYHYWFNGQRLLDAPINAILSEGTPNFPFCICWANQSWSRRWIGDDQQILAKQRYSPDDDINHGRLLAKIFSDRRYIKVQDRPLFLIYRPGDIPNIAQVLDRIFNQCDKSGILRPYFVAVDAHQVGHDFRTDGFDAILAFAPPAWGVFT
jgi:lipopolysaccharide biosynthesis protein